MASKSDGMNDEARQVTVHERCGFLPLRTAAAVLVALTWGAAPAEASQRPTPEQILERHGVHRAPERCHDFRDREALAARSEQWSRAITALGEAHPSFVYGWLIGSSEPPRSAVAESERQRGCLVAGIVAAAARGEVILEFEDGRLDRDDMKRLGRRFKGDARFRAQVVRRFSKSEFRGAGAQSAIWQRKHLFTGRAFNRITPQAARRCRLTAGQLWRPWSKRHQQCWQIELDEDVREQNILQASSAPGISRHHWGTDFDLFSLNPRSFVGSQPWADEYSWLAEHGLDYGFFQTYQGPAPDQIAYMEERWHWSYYPISGPLLAYAEAHQEPLERALVAQWDGIERIWNRGRTADRAYFSYIRKHWRDYFFNVAAPPRTEPQESAQR